MKSQYLIGMFVLCFCVWTVVVDNVVLPSMDGLAQDVGLYSRYRVKEWNKGKKIDLLKNELLVYAYVKDREQLYYMEYTPQFEATLRNLPQGAAVQLRHAKRFPKIWKRHLYDLRQEGIPIMRYSPTQLMQKQKFIWKFSAVVGGIYLFLVVLGLMNKPKAR
ncbi:MAG: hypothetical protein OES84_04495 [Kiritimatiellaceae bacterium]|nr:hypothetical protein [Kiritimatiellaceae bacterium]